MKAGHSYCRKRELIHGVVAEQGIEDSGFVDASKVTVEVEG
jgi:hypothetical protein